VIDASRIQEWLTEAARVVSSIDPGEVAAVVSALAGVRERGGTIFIAGNGGSAAAATHLALDLQKAARPDGRGTRAVALSDSVGLITAWANDDSFERVFAEQLDVLARPGDALLVISVSGDSPNVIAALEAARRRGLLTAGVLGRAGGRAGGMVDVAILVPSSDYGWVESAHAVLHHVLTYAIKDGGPPLCPRPDAPR
jgi:D-sedoheptulose 7-phosphate isomerase